MLNSVKYTLDAPDSSFNLMHGTLPDLWRDLFWQGGGMQGRAAALVQEVEMKFRSLDATMPIAIRSAARDA